ncbi:MAG: peptidylprolyl isomerase [Chitinophagales bacterium]|nr:peptidylprolyl isomerase [Bacteroidota bacterium]
MKKITFFLLGCISVLYAQAQENKNCLISIENDCVTVDEFKYVYEKNNQKDKLYSDSSINEYLDLYTNFKLKVKEAENLGKDTTASFKKELSQYRNQLAQNYLIDRDVTDELIEEAYNRSKTERKVSHILVGLAPDASSEDSLKAFKKAIQYKSDIVLKDEDFNESAQRYSEDPSARENKGELGYISTFQTIYPFETGVYNTPVGKISDPVRSKYGFHLIKVEDERPALGKRRVAHILLKVPKFASEEMHKEAKTNIYAIYDQLKAGEKFETLAKEKSDDKVSAFQGGDLGWFSTGKMVENFENQAFTLKNIGDISEPFETEFGWHIIKLLDSQPIGTFDQMRSEIKAKVEKDSRSERAREHFITKLKKEYKFTENASAFDNLNRKIDEKFTMGMWQPDPNEKYDDVIFSINKRTYRTNQFVDYVVKNQKRLKIGEKPALVLKKMYQDFIDQELIAMEDANLETKYPEFKRLMEEYHDGILLFELTNDKVWEKALTDTAGLENYYEKHKDKYLWNERVKADIYTFKDAKVAKKIHADLTKGKSIDNELHALNEANQFYNISTDIYEKGNNDVIDSVDWKEGVSRIIEMPNNDVKFVVVKEVMPPSRRTLAEAKGFVVSDYQGKLEKEWVNSLRKKYPVKTNQDVLQSLIKP